MLASTVNKLLISSEPAIRWKVLVQVLEREPESPPVSSIRNEIKSSKRVHQLLSERTAKGDLPHHPYAKWYGAHWILASLADLAYPSGDQSLIPLREQVYAWLLSPSHEAKIRSIDGRTRHHASQEGNALFYLLALGLADNRTEQLAERLQQSQWPDGGWNCDKRPKAVISSFTETLLPLRGLALHARLTGNRRSDDAAQHAADFFLKRRLFKKLNGGQIISEDFVRLHYPRYWHYDVLFALQVMAEARLLHDERSSDALDLLEEKQLPTGGFAAENKYYRVTGKLESGRSLTDWGGISSSRMNEFITVEAMTVLKAAGRLGNWRTIPRSNHDELGQLADRLRPT